MAHWWTTLLVIGIGPALVARGDSTPSPAFASGWPREINGKGLTIEQAKQDAVKHVVELLESMMQRHDPPLNSWWPSPDYVKRQVIVGKGRAGPDEPQEELGTTTKTWIYAIRPVDLLALDREAQRDDRRLERVEEVLPLFGAYALALALVTGYFRAVSFWRRLR